MELKDNSIGLNTISFDDQSKIIINTDNSPHLPKYLIDRANSDVKRFGPGGPTRSYLYGKWSQFTNHGRDLRTILSLPIMFLAGASILNLFLIRFFSAAAEWNFPGAVTMAFQGMFGVDPAVKLDSYPMMTAFMFEAVTGVSLIAICSAAITIKLLRNAEDV